MSARAARKWSPIATSASDPKDGAGDSDVSIARTRDEEFWYSDGSIILVAHNVEFRVYKGLLTRHSPVFRDMFAPPQPPVASSSTLFKSADTLCPVVHLSDTPKDLRHILRVFMPRRGPRYVCASCFESGA